MQLVANIMNGHKTFAVLLSLYITQYFSQLHIYKVCKIEYVCQRSNSSKKYGKQRYPRHLTQQSTKINSETQRQVSFERFWQWKSTRKRMIVVSIIAWPPVLVKRSLQTTLLQSSKLPKGSGSNSSLKEIDRQIESKRERERESREADFGSKSIKLFLIFN